MKFMKSLLAAAAMVAATSASAAVVVGTSLQDGINALYSAASTNTALAPNVNTDQLDEGGHFYMPDAVSGSKNILTIELSTRDNRNFFGIYDLYDTSKTLQLFGGGANEGNSVTLNLVDVGGQLFFQRNNNTGTRIKFGSGSQFGFYLQSALNPTGPALTTTYSNVADNGGIDSFIAFQGDGDQIKLPDAPQGAWGPTSFLLAFDTSLDGVADFDDFVVYASNLAVPEPGSLALLGLGLAGLATASRRKAKKA